MLDITVDLAIDSGPEALQDSRGESHIIKGCRFHNKFAYLVWKASKSKTFKKDGNHRFCHTIFYPALVVNQILDMTRSC